MITAITIVQSILFLWILIEIIMLRRCRQAFEELILKFVEVGQTLYDRLDTHNKKLSDNIGGLGKSVQSSLSLKNDVKVLEGTVKDLQGISKYIRTSALKEFKDVEDGIKKLKNIVKEK